MQASAFSAASMFTAFVEWARSISLHAAVLDYIVLCLLVLSVVVGVIRGFIKEIVSVVFLVASIWLSVKYSHAIALLIMPYIKHMLVAKAVAFLTILITVLMLGWLCSKCCGFAANTFFLSILNRLAGAIFGLIRGACIVVVFFLLCSVVNVTPKCLTDSVSYHLTYTLLLRVGAYFPSDKHLFELS